jgi:hypothetical protein
MLIIKVQFEQKLYGTQIAYDNSVNYRFTVPTGKGGKYCIFSCNLTLDSQRNRNQIMVKFNYIFKNGGADALTF